MFRLKFAKSFQKVFKNGQEITIINIERLWQNNQARLENTTTKHKDPYCVTAVIYARNYIIKLCGQYFKTFFATIGVFPYDLDRGYAYSDVIKHKKVL